MSDLQNRLAVHVCHDLAKDAPKTYSALKNWLAHCGFWLAELSACPKTQDQVNCMIGYLGLALVRENRDFALPQACQAIREHMTLHQLTRQS